MRDKHKHQIKDQLIAFGFTLDEIKTHTYRNTFTFSYIGSSLVFTWIQSKSNPEFYGYTYSQYNFENSPLGATVSQNFDTVFNKFTEWLVKHVRPYQEDRRLGDPFKAHQESKGFIFNDAEVVDDNPEDDLPFSESEQQIFAEELKAFESSILTKSLLQEKEIESLKKSVNLLIEASKTESKSEVKKGVGKLLNDLAVELMKYGIIEGAKKYLLPLLFTLNSGNVDPRWIA